MFLDETGSTTTLLRRYGRAPRGARVHAHAPCGRWQTSTFLAAWRVTGLTAPGVFDGAIDGERFRADIDQILVPTLHPGDIVIADQPRAHKVAGIQRALQAAGATLWYVPPYSPNLNPIELCFAKLKGPRSHRSLSPHRDALAVPRECLAHFSPDECRNSFGTADTRPPHGHEKRFRRASSGVAQHATDESWHSVAPPTTLPPSERKLGHRGVGGPHGCYKAS